MKYLYNVGDRVVRASKGGWEWSEYGPDVGQTGEIVKRHVHDGWPAYGVEWDEGNFRGSHDCGGMATDDRGYYVMEDELEPESSAPVIDPDVLLRLLEAV